MVVLLDLDEDGAIPYQVRSTEIRFGFSQPRVVRDTLDIGPPDYVYKDDHERVNPNINSFSAALACYPIVVQLSRALDLNSLHALSRTCRQVRANLLQFDKHLARISLRCVNEPWSLQNGEDLRLQRGRNRSIQIFGIGCMTSGKTGPCARDLVSECRRCKTTVCRNCTMKSPSRSALPNRVRRLCSTCLAAPLGMLIDPCSIALSPPKFTTSAFIPGECSCADMIHLCQMCGHALSSADTTYKRIWTWRTRYSTYLGGLGTGIGEGNEGVKCGRGDHCLAAKVTELEIDCAVDGISSLVWLDHTDGEPGNEETWADVGEKAGYLTQEIEGIGGVVKKKVKKRVRVGKTVTEYEDERERAMYLGREIAGKQRAWCGWCNRVIPSAGDPKAMH